MILVGIYGLHSNFPRSLRILSEKRAATLNPTNANFMFRKFKVRFHAHIAYYTILVEIYQVEYTDRKIKIV